ncbi:MAG: putative capsid protein [Prokaryotic dsDNA virus sp.]|nr:MAG: putative capsid protein [Prokaryotic dsDNA virus sp.]|tara:strand:+ start:2673 stop:4514 length:1842 start_codon:yes stop_codon:yes gene_type:complete
MATLSQIDVGTTVSFNLRGDESGLTHGVITSINTQEETANVKVWARLDNGGHSETDRTLTVDISKLRVIADFREEKQVSQRVSDALRKKVEEHNEKYGDNAGKRVTLRMLEAVFRRGVGAYRTNPQSVRGNVTSADMWAYARVNSFLYAVRNGRFRGGRFDLDLLPRAHPLSSKKEYKGLYDDLDFRIPKGAKEEARRGLEWRKEFGRGGTEVGIASARYISNTDTASPERVRKIAQYFPRHEVDKRAEGYRPGEDGYPSNGRIAWALWGGEAGKSWSQKLVRAMNKRDEKAESSLELISRRNKLREENWEYRTNRFRDAEVKEILFKEHDKLLGNWETVIQDVYFDLLQSQDLKIRQQLNRNALNDFGVTGLIDFAIDENVKSWSADVYDLYLSLLNDFAFYQVDLLLPNEKTNPHVIPNKQERNRNEIIQQGFFFRLVSVERFPLENLRSNREAIDYVNQRINQMLPGMAKTSKDRFNRAFRKALEDGTKLNYTGRRLQSYVANEVKKVLSKQNLNRALIIARTETNALANLGRQIGAKSTGIIYTKEWISQRDGVVRDAHVSLDGTEVNEDDNFVYQGYKLDYPGDSSLGAPANLTVNCRCFLSYHEKRV